MRQFVNQANGRGQDLDTKSYKWMFEELCDLIYHSNEAGRGGESLTLPTRMFNYF